MAECEAKVLHIVVSYIFTVFTLHITLHTYILHITAAKAGSEIIVLYNVKSILTDNSI